MKQNSLYLMCVWLNAQSRQASDKLFTDYYHAIAGPLLAFARWQLPKEQSNMAQDVLQEVIINHLKYLSTIRPDNEAKLQVLLDTLRQSQSVDMYSAQLAKWAADMEWWVSRTMAIHGMATHGEARFMREFAALNDTFATLQKDGLRLFSLARQHCQQQHPEMDLLETDEPFDPASDIVANAVRAMVKTFSDAVKKQDMHSNATPVTNHATRLALVTGEVLTLSFSIRLPTLTLLYNMLYAKILDLRRANPAVFVPYEAEEHEAQATDHQHEQTTEKELMLMDCRNLLFRPMAQAEANLKRATSKQEMYSYQQKLMKNAEKYWRNCAILELALDGYTESEMVDILAISRDKIRTCKAEIKSLLTPYVG